MDKPHTVKKTQKKNKQKSTEKKTSFRAQINCKCNKNCAELVDVIDQKEIFDQFYGYKKWSEKTEFLRSISKRESVKENLHPRINLKNRDFFSTYYFSNASGEKQRVCLSFVVKLLQINRSKIFRAVASIENNPYAVDRRGKAPKRKTATEDIAFAKQFIQSFPSYESKIDSNSFDTKYLHPNLTLNTVYHLYENTCEFKQKTKLSKSVFIGIFKTNFPHLQAFKTNKSKCSICHNIDTQKKFKVLSPAVLENIQKQKDEHFAALGELKDELINSVHDPVIGVTHI